MNLSDSRFFYFSFLLSIIFLFIDFLLSLRDLDVFLIFNYVFSLFRSDTLEGAETRFSIYKDKVPVLVQIVREVIFLHFI